MSDVWRTQTSRSARSGVTFTNTPKPGGVSIGLLHTLQRHSMSWEYPSYGE